MLEQAACATAYPRDLALHLEDEDREFQIECLIFEQDDTQLRALFKHGSFEVAERLLRFVQIAKSTVNKLKYLMRQFKKHHH